MFCIIIKNKSKITGVPMIKRDKILRIFLWLIALHSFLVGLLLLVLPSDIIQWLGFGVCEDRFFPSQGGVFHIVLAIGYFLATLKKKVFESLILYAILVKLMATIFLAAFYLFVSSILLVLFSAVSDFTMFLLLLWGYYPSIKRINSGEL